MCHQVPENSVLGVVSMKVSLDKINAEQVSQRWKSILVAFITAIPVLGLIYPFILFPAVGLHKTAVKLDWKPVSADLECSSNG